MCHHWLLDMRMLDLLTAMGKPPFVVVDLQKKVAWFPVIAREREARALVNKRQKEKDWG
jgi:hypothetical protein